MLSGARREGPEDGVQKPGQVVEDEAEVVASTAQEGVDGIAHGSLEVVPVEPAIALHVADHSLQGAGGGGSKASKQSRSPISLPRRA